MQLRLDWIKRRDGESIKFPFCGEAKQKAAMGDKRLIIAPGVHRNFTANVFVCDT